MISINPAAGVGETDRAVDDCPFFARKDSRPVFLFPVCRVGRRGFFGEIPIGLSNGLDTASTDVEGELDRDLLTILLDSFIVEAAGLLPKKLSIPF